MENVPLLASLFNPARHCGIAITSQNALSLCPNRIALQTAYLLPVSQAVSSIDSHSSVASHRVAQVAASACLSFASLLWQHGARFKRIRGGNTLVSSESGSAVPT